MGLFSKIKRSQMPSDPIDNLDRALNEVLEPSEAPDKVHVSEESALGLSAVWSCVRILSNSTGILPIHLYEKSKSGREIVSKHAAVSVINNPSEYWTRFDLLQWLMTSVLLWGNGYVRIHRDRLSYAPISLSYLYPYDVSPELGSDGRLRYWVKGEMIDPGDIIHIKGLGTNPIKGLSPISKHRENLALSMEAQAYGERFFSKGGNTSGVFEYPQTLKEEQYKRLRDDLRRKMAGIENAHSPLLLEGGLKYNRINIPLEDAQFITTRKFQSSEIAGIFGVPPHMIGNLDKATYNNTELMGIEYVTYSLMPWLTRLQMEFNRKLLRTDEQGKLYFSFQVNGLMRGDAKSRSEYYKNMSMIGAISANEIRELEDMNAYPAGDKYFVQLNMTTADKAGEPETTENNE